jgi:hypothetical protein
MPQGSLIPKEVRSKIKMFEKVIPPEVSKQLKTLAEAERSFVIPIKMVVDDKPKYFILAGILLKEKVDASPNFDANDIELLRYALERAERALQNRSGMEKKDETVKEESEDENDEDDSEGEEA